MEGMERIKLARSALERSKGSICPETGSALDSQIGGYRSLGHDIRHSVYVN